MSNYTAVQSHKEKLDRVYVCTKCKASFLFRSDVEDHGRFFAGHIDTYEVTLG